jgi:dihydrolipoamide dehydrogenase
VGRKPYTADLGLENVGIVPDKRGVIPTDDHWRTSAERVWAIGDVIKGIARASFYFYFIIYYFCVF